MNAKSTYKIFFAIPFDPATGLMYDKIIDALMSNPEYEGRLRVAKGNREIRPSSEFPNMQAFKDQNASLLDQFYSEIRSSDIIVADLTNNNPNVHLELGIALSLNKNILRVSGRNVVEIASDIKGYYVDCYPTCEELDKKLREYLRQFLQIKDLPLNSKDGGPFYAHHGPLTLGSKSSDRLYYKQLGKMRDGELRATFSLSSTLTDNDWFGVYIRSVSIPTMGGILIYVRKNGSLEIAGVTPEISILKKNQYSPLALDQSYILHIKVDGSKLVASLDHGFQDPIEVDDVDNQSYGFFTVASWRSEVHIESVETITRDTINFEYSK